MQQYSSCIINRTLIILIYILMIQDKQISRNLFYREVWNSIEAFLIKHPSKILHPQQRQRLLKGLSRYLEDDYDGPHYIEVDFQDRVSMNPYASLEKIEEEALLQPMSIEENNNQSLEVAEKLNLVQLYDDLYEDKAAEQKHRPIMEVNNQSEPNSSQSIPKYIIQNVMEAQCKRVTRSNFKRKIGTDGKSDENSKNQIKIEEELPKYLQTKALNFQPERPFRQFQQSQENHDESETYLYYQKKYQCKRRENKANHQSKISKRRSKHSSKKRGKSSEQGAHKRYRVKGRKPEFPDMQKKLIAWIEKMCRNNTRITQAIIRNRAMALVNERPYEANGFRASKGWMQKFFKRHSSISLLLARNNKLNLDEYIEDEVCKKMEAQQSEEQGIFEE